MGNKNDLTKLQAEKGIPSGNGQRQDKAATQGKSISYTRVTKKGTFSK